MKISIFGEFLITFSIACERLRQNITPEFDFKLVELVKFRSNHSNSTKGIPLLKWTILSRYVITIRKKTLFRWFKQTF